MTAMRKTRRGASPAAKGRRRAFLRVALFVFLVLVAGAVAAGSFVIATFDLNAQREVLARFLTQESGRSVSLSGPLSWRFSFTHGFFVEIRDVSLGNPRWAKTPHLARVGALRLHVSFAPLLGKRLEVRSLEIEKADVHLETSASGAVNWTLESQGAGTEAPNASTKKDVPMALELRKVVVKDSRLDVRSGDGTMRSYAVSSLEITNDVRGTRVLYVGTLSGKPASFALAGGGFSSLRQGASWPFNLKASWGAVALDAKGVVKDSLKSISVEESLLTAGKTSVRARGDLSFGGVRPVLRGAVEGAFLDPSVFIGEASAAPPVRADGGDGQKKARVFSDEPLDFSGLRGVDAHLSVMLKTLVWGALEAQDVSAALDLVGGRLTLVPVTLRVAGGKAEGRLTLDAAASPPRFDLSVKAPSLDMARLISLSGAESFLAGQGAVDLSVQSSVRSLHDFAAHADGVLSVEMVGGDLSSSVLRSMAGSVLDIFAPGIGSLMKMGIHCLAARYVVKNGLMDTKGFLIDTETMTVAGGGYINLADERPRLLFHTKPKGGGLGSFLPSLQIAGTLAAPEISLEGGDATRKAVGLLLGTPGAEAASVPTLVAVPAGQNACAVTLDRPSSAKSASEPVVKPLVRDKTEDIKSLGRSLLNSFGKGLLGQ